MKICVYGASSVKTASVYIDAVEELGEKIATHGHGLVFGGGSAGLMGAAVRGATAHGGYTLGISPKFFNADGRLYDKCTEFIYTDTMRERKKLLEDSSDAFVIVPGGIGTFDEFFEILTLKQLGRHSKAIAVFNVNGYYDSLISMMQNALDNDFIAPATLELYKVCNNCDEVIAYLEEYTEESIGIKDTKYV